MYEWNSECLRFPFFVCYPKQVSYGSELSNRAPTFDMNLSDFMDGGKPISYENARKYFGKDPAQKWAAYVAGTILVLMRELGVRFEDSISMLVPLSLFYVSSQLLSANM